LETDIEKMRDIVEETNGTSKWSSCYDDCIKIINKHK